MSRSSLPPPGHRAKPSIDELLQQGLALHQSGRAAEAAPLYERVLARDPGQPAANHLLGLVRLQQGDPREAVRLIARAVQRDPRNAQYLTNLGAALNAAEEYEQAIVALDRAIASNPDFAGAYSNKGMALRALGKFSEAADAYREAIRLKPAEAVFHLNLANAHSENGDPSAAEVAYRRALELRPQYPAASAGLASLLSYGGRAEEALALVDEALASTTDEPMLHLYRATSLQHLGRLQEAASGFDHTIRLAPGLGQAHVLRSYLVRHERRDGAIQAMEKLFGDPAASADDRITAGFGLGKALADIGEHGASVEVFIEVNRLSRRQRPFSLERAVAQFDRDLTELPGLDAPEFTGQAEPKGPIFVVGLPRAGKSTVELILSRHPSVAGAGELPTLGRLVAQLRQETGAAPISSVPPDRLAELGRAYLEEAGRAVPAGSILVDTMPSNFRHIGFIRHALPTARIVWCRRPRADHCVAIFEKYLPKRGNEYSNEMDDLLAYHAAYLRLMEGWRQRFPGSVHAVDIGGIASGTGNEIVELLAFCLLEPVNHGPLDVRSEPQLGDWPADRIARNWADHLAAWRQVRPDLWP